MAAPASPVEPVASLDPLLATVDFARVGRAAARFSEGEPAQLSARTLRALPDAAVRGNLATLADAMGWAARARRCSICSGARSQPRRRVRKWPAGCP